MTREIHIDTTGMTDNEKTVALITAICENISVKRTKRKAKDIREDNRRTEKKRKKQKKWSK